MSRTRDGFRQAGMQTGLADGMRKMALAALAVFIFISLSSAQIQEFQSSTKESFESRLSPQTGSWYPVAIIAILISIFAIALIYMAGEFFRAESLKRYARAEFLQVVASALIIFFAVALLYELSGGGAFAIMGKILGEGSTIGCAAAPGGRFLLWEKNSGFGSGPIAAFQCKTQERINGAETCYADIYSKNKFQELLTSTCISFFGFPVYCFDWDLQEHVEVEQAHLLSAKLVSLLIALHAEYALAGYVGSTMLSVFLPLGIVLRIFPFTRGVGGLFIAMAIGFYFIWPTFAVLADPSLIRVSATEQPGATLKNGCFTGFKGAATILGSAFASTGTGIGLMELSLESCTNSLYQITVSTMFYPFVAFVIALVAIRAMAPLLGGDLGELMRMVARLG